MSASEETLRLLTSIDAKLGALLELAGIIVNRTQPVHAMNDRICDGPHGDPIVKAKDPRDWTLGSMKGRHFSECPPEYLDLLADRFDYFASKETDETKQKYNVLDARRARAWAARIRSGWAVQAEPQTTGEPTW